MTLGQLRQFLSYSEHLSDDYDLKVKVGPEYLSVHGLTLSESHKMFVVGAYRPEED